MQKIDYRKRVDKPWGYEVIWAKSHTRDGYVGKVLFINAGHRLSFQYHEEKEETIFVRSGTLYLETSGFLDENGDSRIIELTEGMSFHIPPLYTHRFEARDGDVELFEVSTNHLDDIIRLSDDYGR